MRSKSLLIILLHISLLLHVSCDSHPYPGGKQTYERYCENCHMRDGTGLPPMYPDLPSSTLININIDQLPCLIRNGRTSEYMDNVAMPGIPINEIEMTNLINYISHQWGDEKVISMQSVKQQLQTCE